jgi:putative addiction module antidote
MELTITKIGDSEGVVLPKEILERMQLKSGDKIHIIETAGGIQLSTHDAGLNKAMELAEQVMLEDRDVLEKLAE